MSTLLKLTLGLVFLLLVTEYTISEDGTENGSLSISINTEEKEITQRPETSDENKTEVTPLFQRNDSLTVDEEELLKKEHWWFYNALDVFMQFLQENFEQYLKSNDMLSDIFADVDLDSYRKILVDDIYELTHGYINNLKDFLEGALKFAKDLIHPTREWFRVSTDELAEIHRFILSAIDNE